MKQGRCPGIVIYWLLVRHASRTFALVSGLTPDPSWNLVSGHDDFITGGAPSDPD